MKRLTILLAALGALLLVSAAPAFAAEELPFKETFGSAEQPSMSGQAGMMAVDSATGDLLVVDFEETGVFECTGKVRRFHADGTADNFSALGTNAIDGASGEDETPQGVILGSECFPQESEIAVAPPGSAGGTAGDIYVTDAVHGQVDVFAPSGKYIGQKSFGGYPTGVAVGPTGHVFVAELFSSAVRELVPSSPGSLTETASFSVGSPFQVAAAAGYVYATSGGVVHKIEISTGEDKYSFAGSIVGVAVDPATGHVFGSNSFSSRGEEYDASGASEATLLAQTPAGVTLPYGVAVGDSPHALYLTRESNPNVAVYTLPEEGGPEPPTNRRTLTLTKSPSPSAGTGIGTVSSKPKGIKCAVTCESAVGSFYKESTVILTAKPSLTSTFVEWGEGACEGSTSPTCEVAMSEDRTAEAVFGGTSKAILSPTALTLAKEGSGYGAVKATGLACEAECTTTTSLYQGTITEPKPKEAKTVVLSQVPAYGSEFSGWSGCDSEPEGKCQVQMSEAKEVTATYTAKPNVALTVSKNTEAGEYAGGTGTVTSKPKGIKCATTCTTQTMAVPSGETVALKAKAALGMTFVGWGGVACTSETVSATEGTCTVSLTEAGTVVAEFSGSPKAIASETALTLAKAGSGFGTVKATGLTCEALCSSATSLYQGTVVEPKPKEAKIVVLKATSAPGSQTVVWSGCDSEPEGNCQVQMSEVKEVTATFDELE